MKIELEKLTLCQGQDAGEFPENLSIKGNKDLQTVRTLRGKTARIFDRGNLQTTIRFRNKRRHETLEAASRFIMEHATKVAEAVGELTVTLEGKAAFRLADASVKAVESTINGTITEHSYEILGSCLKQNT